MLPAVWTPVSRRSPFQLCNCVSRAWHCTCKRSQQSASRPNNGVDCPSTEGASDLWAAVLLLCLSTIVAKMASRYGVSVYERKSTLIVRIHSCKATNRWGLEAIRVSHCNQMQKIYMNI
ncbi:hypothetical protein CI102_297 [Trichoderma harzianum]|nr:hypothetical protein CI102_297 [Trichoderma harzianum]